MQQCAFVDLTAKRQCRNSAAWVMDWGTWKVYACQSHESNLRSQTPTNAQIEPIKQEKP